MTRCAPGLWLMLSVYCLRLSAQSPQERLQTLAGLLENTTVKLQEQVASPGASIDARDLTNGALAELVLGRSAEAETLLRMAFDRQDLKAGGDYGTMPWDLSGKIHDANAIDFASEAMGPILLGHGGEMTPAFLQYLRPHMVASLAALERHDVPVSYTNIYLMNATARLLISQWLHDETAHSRARMRLEQWLQYTHSYGIHEFDSPTYSAVALSSLYAGCGRSETAADQEIFRAALQWFWTDLSANFFSGARRIGGSHSRDYDFLRGRGSSEIDFYVAGLMDKTPRSLDLEKSLLIDNFGRKSCTVEIVHWPADRSRVVTQRWDEDSEKTRTTYITPSFSMGFANGDYGPQDKMFAIDLASADDDLPSVSIVTTASGIPYGKDSHLDSSGHPKPKHLPNHLAGLQDKGVALLLLAPDAGSDKVAPAFYTDMLLPLKSEFSLNGVVLKSWSHVRLLSDDVLRVRRGDVCLAIREQGPDSGTEIVLQTDADGMHWGAARLTASRARTADLRVVVLAAIGDCSSGKSSPEVILKQASITGESKGRLWSVEAHAGVNTFSITYDTEKHVSLQRKINGLVWTAPVFSVKELGNAGDVAGAPHIGQR